MIKSVQLTASTEDALRVSLKDASDYKYALEESCMVVITDQEGIINHANDNFCKISKYHREELIGQDYRNIISDFHTKDFIRSLWETIADGKKWRGELKNKVKAGTYYCADTTIIPSLNEEGRPYQYVVIQTDITQSKLAEEELQIAYKKLLFYFENATLGYIEWDNQLHIKLLSKKAEEIFGWTKQEFIENEKNGYSQVYKEDLALATKITEDLVKGLAGRNSVQHRNITKDGKVIWCEWFNSVLKDKEGKVTTIMSLVQDITERKEAEEKINRANRLYSFIREVDQNILHVKDEKALFHNSCRIAHEFGKFKMAWIGMFDTVNKKISLIDQSGIPEEDIGLFTNAPYEVNGPQDCVLRTGNYYIWNDIEKELELQSWKRFAAKHGICSCMVLPIKKSGIVIGTFNLYASELNFSNKEEIALLAELTGNICFAIDIFENSKKQKAIEELVVNNERQFHHILDNILEGIQIHDFNWKYIYVNEELVKYSKYSREELIGYTVMEKYPGIEQTNLFKAMERCMKERVVENLETEFIFPDGTQGYFELSIQPIPEGIFILSIDRSEQQKAKEKLLKVNRLFAFTGAINQSIVHISEEGELLNHVCNIAVEIGQFKMAWIGMLDENGMLIMLNICGDQASAKRVQAYSGMDFNSPLLRLTPIGKALATGSYAVSNDVQNDPAMVAWKNEFAEEGIRANICLPIKKFGKVTGVIGFNSTIANFFDEEEINLLKESASDISFALEIFEKIKKQKETEELVNDNERRFRALIERSTDIKTLSTLDGEMIYGSPSITKVLGYTMEEFLHRSAFEYIHPDDIPGFAEKRKEILQVPGKSFYNQNRFLHKTGNWIWCEGTVTNMLHEPGVNALVSNFRDISEKKIRDEQEEFERNNLAALINNTRDLMWSVDKNFKLIISNQPFDEITRLMSGKTIEKGSNIFTAGFPAQQLSRYKKFYERAFDGEAFTEIEHAEIPTDFWSEISFYPIRNGNEVIGTACHSRDVTERKRSEENLRQSEKRLKESQEIAHLGNWELNFETKVSLWSDEACRIYGLSPLENKQTYEEWESFIHPEDLDYVLRTNNEARKTFSSTNINHRIVLKDGTVKHVFTQSKFEFDQNGKPVGVYGVSHDITDRKIAEENLRKSEARLKDAQAIAQLGNWEIDILNNVHVWSDELYKIFGTSKGEIRPSVESFSSFIHPDDLNYANGKMAEAFITSQNSSFDFMMVRRDGVVRYGYSEWKFEFDKTGNPTRVFGIIQDVTERKLAEMERIKIVNDLMLRNKELEQFAYIVSHNLRAPVANILGAGSRLNDTRLSADKKDKLRLGLNESVARLDDVIKDLNHILEVKHTINEIKEKVRFSKLVDDIKVSIKNLIEKDHIEIKYDFSEIDSLLTLRGYLYSIFYNLIVNSIKYRRQQVPCVIEIKSRLVKNKIDLTFTDNGMGIDIQKRGEQVFGLYKRFHTNIEGKGMGLYMVKTQVETLGGKISIQSEVNKGTKFKIEFER